MGIDDKNKKKVAIKMISKEFLKQKSDKLRSQIKHELKVMKRLDHENILKLEQILSCNQNYYMILEYAPNGDLLDMISKKEKVLSSSSNTLIIVYRGRSKTPL